MGTSNLITKFARIGARVKVSDGRSRRSRIGAGTVSLDIALDRDGEYFEIVRSPLADPEIAVLDAQPGDRHLLLLVRNGKEKQKFLCGHDERHWFVAAVPESAPVGTVVQAKEALKPAEVLDAQGRQCLRRQLEPAARIQPIAAKASGSSCPFRAFMLTRTSCYGTSRYAEGTAASRIGPSFVIGRAARPCMSVAGIPTALRRMGIETSSPPIRTPRNGAGRRCAGMRASTYADAFATPTTKRSCSTIGIACS